MVSLLIFVDVNMRQRITFVKAHVNQYVKEATPAATAVPRIQPKTTSVT